MPSLVVGLLHQNRLGNRLMIIVGTDFSATALIALAEARTLAQRLQADLKLVHVRQLLTTSECSPVDAERIWLRATRTDLQEVEMRRGTPWVELVRVAGEHEALLIVVGTHGHSGFQPIALGSTAERLALLSPVPILLVGTRDRSADPGPAQTTLFAGK